ncbi:MAG: hypothetical protein R2939_05865 [Kofleriaceae bacterium]
MMPLPVAADEAPPSTRWPGSTSQRRPADAAGADAGTAGADAGTARADAGADAAAPVVAGGGRRRRRR